MVCYGNDGTEDETWKLYRSVTALSTEMATAAFNTEDTSISNATVDNSAYKYYFSTSTLDTGDKIYGARITYTL